MKKVSVVLENLKDELSGLLNVMLVSERMNSQRCIAKDVDTTKTIIDHKNESEEFSQEDLNKIGVEIGKLTQDLKGMANEMLVSERINSQRCIAKDIDTTKTIVDHNDNKTEFTKEEINKLAEEAKQLVNTMLVSERINSQKCIAKDVDTTKTIIEHDNKKEEVNKTDINTLIKELKGIVAEMLVSERINSQRCIAKDVDTTKTIIDHKNK
ncbi:hypothetical protein [Romboutsia lituseburensis]|uniref:Uncharacterized protein n=1 Tax=Romboutsia lituseburensis DSM 797 TaxID=1121325 RepID=A0A1G9SLT8_9FIRM|nr:hypothetical protein [Romboutsia lituseburensis]CEH32965.1 Hypothetical protein RLITU_0355 [Romboutsia lituseburensis]SDM36392.1 hypothetical protein SAMN04515677_11017 [Romboutsia lituseburensis DSM 797]